MRSAVVAVLLLAVIGSAFSRSYPLFKQCDSRWGGDSLGSSSTICKVGCLMSSVSMALAGCGKTVGGSPANPKTLNSWLKGHGGYSGNLFNWGSVSSLGLKYQGKISGASTIKSAISANKIVILNVNNGGHWVLATGSSASDFQVNDPGFSRTSYPNSGVSQAAVFTV